MKMKTKIKGMISVAVMLAAASVQAANWGLSSGNWTDDAIGGWDTGEPESGDMANVHAGIVQITAGNDEVCNELRLGNTGENTGTLEMSGGSLTHTNANVGLNGIGTVNITGGSINSAGSVSIGGNLTGTGTVTVDGSGASWTSATTLYVGNVGSGSLTVTNGGAFTNASTYVGRLADGVGSATVTGAGSTWSSSASCQIGATGTGELMVSLGAAVSMHGRCDVGANIGGFGTITVSDAGSTLVATNNALRVGYNGDAVLSISDGGSVITGAGDFTVGHGLSSTGIVTVAGSGSSLTIDDEMIIGISSDSMGVLTITNGAIVSVLGTTKTNITRLCHLSGSTALIVVDGLGSIWNTDQLDIGWGGTNVNATLNITGGGLVTSKDLFISPVATNAVIRMATDGMLALQGDGSASIAAFLDLLREDSSPDNIDYWNGAAWDDIANATLGADATLVYHTSGNLNGYTVLTVFAKELAVGDISITVDGTDAIIGWDGTFGATYTLQSDTDLVVSPSWGDEQTGISGFTGAMSATSTTTSAESFYRVIIE